METVTAKLCQHVETSENEWTCPTCKHVAKTTAKPGRRECGPSKPRAQKPKAIGPRAREDELARKIPTCAHRGAIVEHNKSCQVCGQKNEQYDLYACGIHGTCSLSRRAKAGEKLQACTSCQDFVPLQNLIQSVKPVGTVDVCLIAPALWNLGGIERWLVAMSRYLPLVSGRQVRVSSVVIQFAHMVESEMLAELSQVTTVYSWGNQSQQQAARNAIHQSDVAIISGMGDVSWCLSGFNKPAVWLSHSCCEWSERFCRTARTTGLITHWASVGHSSKAVFPDDLIPHVAALENGSEIDRCTPIRGRQWQRQQWGITDDQIVIGFVGRLSDDKRPQALAEAIAHLPENYVGIAVGEGQHQASILEHARKTAGDRVKFVGRMNLLGDALAAMDFGLIASEAEGFCLSRVEMQLAGLLVVSTPTGEIPRLEDEHGPLVCTIPIGASGEQIASAIQLAQREGVITACVIADAKKLAWERYTAAAMAGRWVDYLQSILEG